MREAVNLIWFEDFSVDESFDKWEERAVAGTSSDGSPKDGETWRNMAAPKSRNVCQPKKRRVFGQITTRRKNKTEKPKDLPAKKQISCLLVCNRQK